MILMLTLLLGCDTESGTIKQNKSSSSTTRPPTRKETRKGDRPGTYRSAETLHFYTLHSEL